LQVNDWLQELHDIFIKVQEEGSDLLRSVLNKSWYETVKEGAQKVWLEEREYYDCKYFPVRWLMEEEDWPFINSGLYLLYIVPAQGEVIEALLIQLFGGCSMADRRVFATAAYPLLSGCEEAIAVPVFDLIDDLLQAFLIPPVLLLAVGQANGGCGLARIPVDHYQIGGCDLSAQIAVTGPNEQVPVDKGLESIRTILVTELMLIRLPIIDDDLVRGQHDQVILGDQSHGVIVQPEFLFR